MAGNMWRTGGIRAYYRGLTVSFCGILVAGVHLCVWPGVRHGGRGKGRDEKWIEAYSWSGMGMRRRI